MKKLLRFIAPALAIMVLISAVASFVGRSIGGSDDYVQDRVVMIRGDQGLCSGIQVRTNQGNDYILTAAHCKEVTSNGVYQVITEDGGMIDRMAIAEDRNSDLLLLQPIPGMVGIPIASVSHANLHVRTFTHGKGHMTYKTEGVLLEITRVDIPLFEIVADSDHAKCSMPKLEERSIDSFFGPLRLCFLSVYEVATTAKIVPGSSGGAVVDSSGRIVGIVSAGDNDHAFGYLVRLTDIQRFLAFR